jgi:hypothetical protein
MSNIDEALRLREAVHRLLQFSDGGLTELGAKDVLRYAHHYAEGRSPATHPHLFRD